MATERRAKDEAEPKGLECVRCGCADFRVTDTEPLRDNKIRRRRRCRHCGHKIVTIEQTPGAWNRG